MIILTRIPGGTSWDALFDICTWSRKTLLLEYTTYNKEWLKKQEVRVNLMSTKDGGINVVARMIRRGRRSYMLTARWFDGGMSKALRGREDEMRFEVYKEGVSCVMRRL